MLSGFCFSQNIVVSGYISCAETGEKLVGANIYDRNSNVGTSTNNSGYYNLILPSTDSVSIIISFVGYTAFKALLPADKNIRLDVDLKPGYLLNEVVIEDASNIIEKRPEMSRIKLSVQQIKKMPAIGGESDILKVVQNTPGVKSGSEWSTGLYVRGGGVEQNLFLLDKVPIYYVNHLGGFVSTFNTDVINSVNFISGGFPANYGSRLSSVMDVKIKSGNMKEFKGSVGIGMITSKIALEGPIKTDTSSYVFAFRRFMYDLITLPISYLFLEGQSVGYSFYDINFKYNHIINPKSHLFFCMYIGEDNYRINQLN